MLEAERPALDQPPDSKRSVVGVIFLTLFIDLVGFSIIFPLFPSMLEYYIGREENGLIYWMVEKIRSLSGQPDNFFMTTVLFGGILGSLYSLLQFLSAPFWGILSDRFGRRSILLITITGTTLSYLLWIFSASFEGLLVARLFGGLMAGNISVATAAIADTTKRKKRGAGMALVGVAFGLGFILGPAIGGLSVAWQPGTPVDAGQAWGWHPFSGPALIATFLALINLFWVILRFPETRSRENRTLDPNRALPHESLSGFKVDIPGIRKSVQVYFTLLFAFSGMEFTLTFLAVERFHYTPAQNGFMFVYIGLLLALIQGGITRRLAPIVGERKLAKAGLFAGIAAFLILAWSGGNIPLFYLGLALMAACIGLASPSLQALVSLYADDDNQGKYLGLQRSAGAFARAIGPFLAAGIFFAMGSTLAYTAGALIMVAPLVIALYLPDPERPAP